MLSQEFYLSVGATQRVQLGFVALCARVDNPSTGWLTVEGQFKTGPFGFGGVVVFVPGSQTVTVVNSATDPSGASVTDNGQQAHVIFYDQMLPPAAPGYQTVSSISSVVVQNDVHVDSSTGVSTPAGYQAADLALPVQLLDGEAGNATPFGTATHPLRTDPTGTTTQPVSVAATLTTQAQPPAGTDITASASAGNTSNVATLAGVAAKTTYITGFQCTASGATAGLDVTVTVAGTITGTMNYTFTFPAGALVAAQPLIVSFPRPVPASATNTAIVVTLPAGGTGNTNASVSVQGFQL